MNIKILDSWLREYLKTKATPKEIGEKLSLTSLSVEKVEKYKSDFLYEMEITTNRPDLFSVTGIARETAAILPTFGIEAQFLPLRLKKEEYKGENKVPVVINNDPRLVNRVSTVLMEVTLGESPKKIKERLEASGIRSLNNLIVSQVQKAGFVGALGTWPNHFQSEGTIYNMPRLRINGLIDLKTYIELL